MINQKFFLVIILFFWTLSLSAITINPNPRDIAESVAAYDIHPLAQATTINIPGTELTGMRAGETSTGNVSNLIARHVDGQANYDVTFHVAIGKMDQAVDSITGSYRGVGLYKEKNLNDMGAVLHFMRFVKTDGEVIPVQLKQSETGGCSIASNTIQFYNGSGDLSTCSIVIHGSDLRSVTQSSPGFIQYFVAVDNSAQPNSTYSNELSYRIAVIQP